MFDTIRRLVDDAYRAQDSGMSVGLPKVTVDASQLKHLLDHYDVLSSRVSITDKEHELFEKLKKVWFHTQPDKSGSFFICDESGERDEMGLPEMIMVCPAYGLDGFAIYKKTKDYSAPEY